MPNAISWVQISPSRTLLRFASKIADWSQGPALDVACGFGRNAIALAAHGCNVICLDRDLSRLQELQLSCTRLLRTAPVSGKPGSIMPVCAMATEECWPFPAESLGAVISVHFVKTTLFASYAKSLISGGYLYVETFGGQGENYLDLPNRGEIRSALDGLFTTIYYREKSLRVQPHAVTVKALARKA